MPLDELNFFHLFIEIWQFCLLSDTLLGKTRNYLAHISVIKITVSLIHQYPSLKRFCKHLLLLCKKIWNSSNNECLTNTKYIFLCSGFISFCVYTNFFIAKSQYYPWEHVKWQPIISKVYLTQMKRQFEQLWSTSHMLEMTACQTTAYPSTTVWSHRLQKVFQACLWISGTWSQSTPDYLEMKGC